MRHLSTFVLSAAALVAATVTASAQCTTRNGWSQESCAKQALSVYESLGPAPGGSKLKGFDVTEEVAFTCPNGAPGKQVSVKQMDGGTAARWACPRQPGAAKK